MRKSFLCPNATVWFSGKRCAGKPARIVWEGGNGKGLESTSPVPYFIWRGAHGTGLSTRWYLAGCLPYDDAYRELKEGWGLEQQRWGRDFVAALGRTTLTCLAFNTAKVYRLQAGERLASVAIRRLRRLRQRQLGSAPAVIYVSGCYDVFSLEELLALLGTPARESLLPALRKSSSSDAPT